LPASKRKLISVRPTRQPFSRRDADATTAEPAPPSSRDLDNTTTKLKATPETANKSIPYTLNGADPSVAAGAAATEGLAPQICTGGPW